MNRNVVWETWWAENLERLLRYLHKGNWLLANNENMVVIISPLKSSFPKPRLQEIACRCHGVLLTCIEQVAPRVYSTSFSGQRNCTVACDWHPRPTPHQNSSTFCSFWKTQVLLLRSYLSPPLPLLFTHQPHGLFLFLKHLKLVPTLGSYTWCFREGNAFSLGDLAGTVFLPWFQMEHPSSERGPFIPQLSQIWFHFCSF